MTQVFISIGSNQNQPVTQVEQAFHALESVFGPVVKSRIYETEPVGPIHQSSFMNAAVSFDTEERPEQILEQLLQLEKQAGRDRSRETELGPRNLDLDLILYGTETMDAKDLQIPHPRFSQRRFVLQPLQEIAPDQLDPVSGFCIKELLSTCKDTSWVRPLVTETLAI